MIPDEEARFAALQGAWCPASLIKELYGLDVQGEGRLKDYFHKRIQPEILREIPGKQGEIQEVHRYRFETLLQANRLMPRKWVAAKIGMTEDSLCLVMNRLQEEGLLFKHYIIPELIEKDFDNDLVLLFRELRFKTFGNYNSFCTTMHNLLNKRLGTKISPLYCVTSKALHEDSPDFAQVFDCISLQPVGMKYKVWLDFKKPMNLSPDYCSTLLYARERKTLDPFVAGTRSPEVPPSLLSSH